MALLNWGLLGLFIGTFLSATLIPFPSEAILIGAYQLEQNFWLVLLIGGIGNFLGSSTNYIIGYKIKNLAVHRRLKIKDSQIDYWSVKIEKWGIILGLIVWIPILGELITILLGYFKLNFWKLAVLMVVGIFGRYYLVLWLYASITN
ncbi:YqaA family protein [Crocinitomix catalasitica]|uniref:YqaA family protein n=1 Tax=Crocinitomix catalasitica TaxID=184607 RepID=UPI00048824DC|nr:YqaA family protein [Crocinitomix catalasitica]